MILSEKIQFIELLIFEPWNQYLYIQQCIWILWTDSWTYTAYTIILPAEYMLRSYAMYCVLHKEVISLSHVCFRKYALLGTNKNDNNSVAFSMYIRIIFMKCFRMVFYIRM